VDEYNEIATVVGTNGHVVHLYAHNGAWGCGAVLSATDAELESMRDAYTGEMFPQHEEWHRRVVTR
jgi:hypothetical protein